MDVHQMREELKKRYHKETVNKWTDSQVIAIYKRLKAKNQI